MNKIGKSVKLSGDLIRKRRAELGLSAEKLKKKSGLSLRTITNAEKGKPVTLVNAGILAEALGVKSSDLWQTSPDESSPPIGQRALIKIVTMIEMINFGDAEKASFMEMLTSRIQPLSPMVIKSIQSGSTIITIEMDTVDIELVVNALLRLRLESLEVTDLYVPSDWESILESTRHPDDPVRNYKAEIANPLFEIKYEEDQIHYSRVPGSRHQN